MRIREIEERDAEAFLRLLCEIDDSNNMLYNPGERKTTVEIQRKIIQAFNKKQRSTFFVAEEKERLIGYIGIMAGDLQRTKHIGRLVIGVSQQSRGLGIGTKLFQEVFEWIREKHFSRLELTVLVSNDVAIKLYEKMGFVKEGKRIDSLLIDGQFVDEWCMFKRV
ncbi:GNAT family N-acetyltransferase [Rummeliibacillus pycnus]|uniref:GNAT family N-acetyltransferase n=1 Tax=Rummeliibacillus pycnus TaxID=101070 RepID=UPI001473F92B|nr:GNAT family N-acetyltransferase [Rummeliibacillus pycnus]